MRLKRPDRADGDQIARSKDRIERRAVRDQLLCGVKACLFKRNRINLKLWIGRNPSRSHRRA